MAAFPISNPFAAIPTIAGGSSGLPKGASSGGLTGLTSTGPVDGLDTFQTQIQQGTIAPNLFKPMPAEGQGLNFLATA